jgi:hypothetical protein
MRKKAREKETKNPAYSPEELSKDLKRVRTIYANLGRDRYAVHKYWEAVYKLRRKWRRLRLNKDVKIKKIAGLAVPAGVSSSSGDLLRFILDQTMTTSVQAPTADTNLSKLKSKYFSMLNFAYSQKVTTSGLLTLIKDHNGLNYNTKSKQKKRASSK